ncbi:MAG TPA: hypothetical protein VFI61_00700 [Patescibacteria group bacterium]|nr:hypothetical protein [Patescibacteria group bacterium]
MVKKLASLFVGLTLLFTLSVRNSLAVNYDMATSGNWNLRVDGAVVADNIAGSYPYFVADVNNNGKNDLVFRSSGADNNSRTTSGSVWIIYDSLLESLSGTGNLIDLADSTKYNIRIDGSLANEGVGSAVAVADINNDGSNDIIIGVSQGDFNSRAGSGSVYIIYGSLLADYSGTGNNIDLATSTNYNLRYDGAVLGDGLGNLVVRTGDLNNDSLNDLVIGASGADFNSRSASGSLYVFYNSLINSYSGTGNNIDLLTSTNYNLRYDGAVAGDAVGLTSVILKDIDMDNKLDISIGAHTADFNSRASSGSLYIVYNTLIDDYAGVGNNIDLLTSTNYNLRYDGLAGDTLADVDNTFNDLDNDGKPDIVVGTRFSDFNSRNLSGSLYVIYNTLIDDYPGTGNNVDLTTTSNFNIRFDGAVALDTFGYTSIIGDYNNDGLLDLIVDAPSTDFNSRDASGSVYVIYNNHISSYTGVGNLVDMATTTNYDLRFDGAVASDNFGFLMSFDDVNNDGKKDLLVMGFSTDNTRSNSNSAWITYNFPHTITESSMVRNGGVVTIKGNVSAPNSTTPISGVQYQTDGNSELNGWNSCSADDGTFNSLTENFTCTATIPDTNAEHVVFVRAYDTNTSYTSRSRYLTYREGSRTPAVAEYLFSAPKPLTVIQRENIISMVNYGAFKYDAFLSVVDTPKIGSFRLPNTNYWQVGGKEEVWWKSFANGAKILPSEVIKPFTLIFKYDQSALEKSIKETSLRLAYSTDGKSWKIIPSTLDTVKNQLVIVTKQGGYYMIVGGGYSNIPTPLIKNNKIEDQENNLTPSSELQEPSNAEIPKKHCFLFICW